MTGDSLKLPECMRLLPPETMGVMRRLEWYARRRMQGTLTGRHSSPDKGFSVEFAECLASCGTAPVCMVNDDFHEGIPATHARELLAKYKP